MRRRRSSSACGQGAGPMQLWSYSGCPQAQTNPFLLLTLSKLGLAAGQASAHG